MSNKQQLTAFWQDEYKKMWLYITLGALLTILVVAYKAHTRWIPDSAEYIAAEIPREVYQTIGEMTLESLDGEEFSPTKLSEEKQQQIKAQFEQLLSKLELDPERYQLHFRSWKHGVNAFALMNGAIVITDDLITTLDDLNQINAVLLHEIGHINNNHLMENTIRVSIFYIILSLVFGDISVVSDLLIEASTMGANFSFSRELELEADAYAATTMQTLYGTIEPLINAFKALETAHQKQQAVAKETSADKDENQGTSALNQWLSTHPPTQLRIEHVKKVTQEQIEKDKDKQ